MTINYLDRSGIQTTMAGVNPLLYRAKLTTSTAALNNLELALAVGIPLFALFLVRGIKSLIAVLHRQPSPGENVQAALFATFLFLNLYGLNRGEIARLWMFWVPVIMVMAVIEIVPFLRRHSWLYYVLLASQFVTLVLTFQFQDLKM
jgi:hypothetical protein